LPRYRIVGTGSIRDDLCDLLLLGVGTGGNKVDCLDRMAPLASIGIAGPRPWLYIRSMYCRTLSREARPERLPWTQVFRKLAALDYLYKVDRE